VILIIFFLNRNWTTSVLAGLGVKLIRDGSDREYPKKEGKKDRKKQERKKGRGEERKKRNKQFNSKRINLAVFN
jgi:hypothetical protein